MTGNPGVNGPYIGGLRHTVNDVAEDLFAGDIAIVRPGETVQHTVLGDEKLRMLGIQAEAGEMDALVERFGFPEAPVE